MNTSRLSPIAVFVAGLLAGVGAVGLWSALAPAKTDPGATPAAADASGQRKIRFYQSPMHPWIRSDKPGRCTICGMELTPVYEGEAGMSAGGPTVVLGTNAIQLIHLETSEVAQGPIQRRLRLSGTLDDNDIRHRVISATVAGRIERLSVNTVGQDIRAGEPLLTIYSPSLLTAEREYVALTKQNGHDGNSATAGMAPIIAAARQRLIQMGLSPSQIDALKDKPAGTITSELRVPADGTVVIKQVYEGQYVSEGERLFETADFSTMWVQLNAYESDRAWLRVGQPARITTPSWNGGVITGRVSFIDPNFDLMTRSSRVRIEVPNPVVETEQGPRRRLLHRVTVMGEIDSTAAGLSVPRSAVLWNGRDAWVYLSQGGGAFEARKVRIGRTGDLRAEVIEGLKAGDRVVTQAAFLLDAQSQLQSGHAGGSSEPEPPPMSGKRGQAPAPLSEFLRHSAELAEALASDRLDGFQAALNTFPLRLETLKGWATDPANAVPDALRSSITAAAVPATKTASAGPATLAEARKWFLDQSRISVELARWAHRQGWAPPVRVFECPMVDRAIPSAPKRAQWLQIRPEVRNPFFGAEMLDCGLELKEKP